MTTKTRKFGIRTLTLILAFLMIVYVVPLTVIAENIRASSNATTEEATETTTAIKDVFELTDRREETVKHFRTEDGSIVAVVYPNAVHRQDDSGAWQDIDNRLAENGSEIATSDARVKFAKKITGNETLFTLHDGNYKLTMSLDGAQKKTAATITNTVEDENASALGKQMTLENLSARILYSNILENVDLEYVVVSNDIKENIIVKAPGGTYAYTFTLQLNNLTAQQATDGSIGLYDRATGERVYVFPRGYMQDAAGARSTAVSYSLTDHGNGKYTFTATADKGWMNAPERIFPVTIDPPIYTGAGSNVTDLYVNSSSVNENNSSSYNLFVSPTQRTYWKLNTLPTLPASAYITNAELFMHAFAAAGSGSYIGVYQVTSDWTQSLTWAGVVSSTPAGSIAETYIDARPMVQAGTFSWNVLPVVQSWYEGTANYGLALSCLTSGTNTFYSNDFNIFSLSPQLCITYRDTKGIEDYWTYSSQDLGFAGTGHVNLATGHLTFAVPTLSTLDALMPFTLSLVYNSQFASQYYTSSTAKTVYTAEGTPSGFKFNTQESLIEQSYVKQDGTTATCFILADGDGTEHYFLPTDTANEFIDEDGLLLTLTKGSTTCTITDSSHGVRTFKKETTLPGTVSCWTLSTVQDAVGNTLTIENNDNMLPIKIIMTPKGHDEGITQLEIWYNTAGRPYLILNKYSHEAVVLQYSRFGTSTISTAANAGYLLHAIRARGTSSTDWLAYYNAATTASTSSVTVDAVATYSYFYDGATLLDSVTNGLSDYTVSYSYTSGKVTEITEQGGTTTGQSARITYHATSTRVRTSGNDDVINNTDDLYAFYQFDAAGRAISSYSTDYNQSQVFSGAGVQYSDGENIKANNQIKTATQAEAITANHIRNGGFEMWNSTLTAPSYWTITGSVTDLPGAGHGAVTLGMYGGSSVSQTVALKNGEYTLSMLINTALAGNLSVQVSATSLDNSAHSVSKTVPVDRQYASGVDTYVELSLTAYTITGPTESFVIQVSVTGSSTQNICIDDVMLSGTIGAANYSVIEAGDFVTTAGVAPSAFWSATSGSITVSDYAEGRYNVLSIPGSLGQTKHVSQTIRNASSYYSTGEINTYTVTGWVKGTGQAYGEESLFGARITIAYQNSAGSTITVDYDIPAAKSITDWQYLCGTIVSDPAMGTIQSATLTLLYNDHPGTAYFDDIAVVIDSLRVSIYTYGDSTGLLSEATDSGQTVNYTYDNNYNLTHASASDGTYQSYSYDTYHQLKSVIYGANGSAYQKTEYEYNDYGLCEKVTTTTQGLSSNVESITQYTYYETSPLIGTLKTEIDVNGEPTVYYHDESNGRLLAVIYPNIYGTCYTYDGMGNLTGVYPAIFVSMTSYRQNTSLSTKATYTYDGSNRLSSIVANGTQYNFYYDSFGNSTSVSVNGYGSLASYTYNSYNGKLNTVTYGNGFAEKYVYDELDRISEIKYNTGSSGAYVTAYRYTYSTAGQLISIEDVANGQLTRYHYDTSGKLLSTTVSDTDTNLNETGAIYTYDEHQRLTQSALVYDFAASNGTRRDRIGHTYTYDAMGRVNKATLLGNDVSGTITPTYDRLNRLTARTISLTADGGFYQQASYSYVTGTNGQSSLVSQLQNKIGTSSSNAAVTNTWKYSYDPVGNLTRVIDASNVIQYKYTYDSLGQLIREDNAVLGHTYVYTYDAAGNITSVKQYAFTTGTLGTVLSTDNYTYGNSYWKDLLTKYNDQTIEYDEIGNPTKIGTYNTSGSWGEWQGYNWQGRQLMAVTSGTGTTTGSTLATYRYNDEGIRISKTVAGVEHTYMYNGGQLAGELLDNGIALIYLYDEAGGVIGMKYHTSSDSMIDYTAFFFEKNLQGDIIAIYNEVGTKIGGYTYDAWGKVTPYTATGSTTIEQQIVEDYNPFRYRGYYYDIETGLYYLQSRYYNPEWGRFLSADAIAVITASPTMLTDKNLYAYCDNNPITRRDDGGEFWGVLGKVVLGVGMLRYKTSIS